MNLYELLVFMKKMLLLTFYLKPYLKDGLEDEVADSEDRGRFWPRNNHKSSAAIGLSESLLSRLLLLLLRCLLLVGRCDLK